MRHATLLIVAGLLLAAHATHGAGQQPERQRLRVRVEYIAGANVYLSAGEEAGLQSGDTLQAMRSDGAPLGPFRVVATSSGRSVVTFAGAPFALTRGDSLLVDAPLRPRPEPAVARGTNAPLPAPAPARSPTPERHARIDGRLALDVNALRSETDADGLRGTGAHTWTTPAVRLHAVASGLPADARVQMNMRYEYRDGFTDPLMPASSLRIYQLAIEKDFDVVPAQIRLGRFHDTYDPWGGFWDGGQLRIGGAFGAGVMAGVEPDRTNQGFGGTARKVGAFLDYRFRGAFTWDGAISAQRHTGDTLFPDHEHVALQQRMRWQGLRLSQRLQVQSEGGNGWTLGRFDFDASAAIATGLTLRAHYAAHRERYPWLDEGLGPRRTRFGAGLLIIGGAGSLTLDASSTAAAGEAARTALSGSFALERGVPGLRPGGSASYWTGPDGHALHLVPRIGLPIGRGRIELSWQHYRGEFAGLRTRSDGGDATLTLPLGERLHSMLRAAAVQGDGYTSVRMYTSLWIAL